MKKLFILIFLFLIYNGFSQEIKLKEYSHTEFFNMIAAEKDSVFNLQDAFISFTEKDSAFAFQLIDGTYQFKTSDTIFIDKVIELVNVHFEHNNDDIGQQVGFPFIVFNKDVIIADTTSMLFFNCVFKGVLEVDVNTLGNDQINKLDKKHLEYEPNIGFYNTTFNNDVIISVGSIENYSSISFKMFNNTFISEENRTESQVATSNIKETHFDENIFKGNGFFNLNVDTSMFLSVYRNNFGDFRIDFSKASLNNAQVYLVEENSFNKELLLRIDEFSINHTYRWKQWENKVLSAGGFDLYLKSLIDKDKKLDYYDLYYTDSVFNNYKNRHKIEYENAYKFEMQLLGQFYDFYKLQHDSDYANQVYVEFKNLETKRYAYLYKENPTFSSFFTWKINQFLKIFSSYGTNPSLSIIFSLYVIFLFAFVYMLFPNNWETGRKNKLMNRLRFFTKYFRQNEGIREIYEEERQQDIMSYTEFKDYMHNSKKEVPWFFLWLTKPIYYFSSYNYKLTGRILRHTDILKGRWVDLPKRKKIVTSFIIGCWILALLIVDILIKFLNALTLSINTFTTLGFGEIPIKGIPRYLAVIQGFIGWFMLTIFSVALISQLLN
ncbi:ion channel [Polaribacter gochangensis]|uniref:ion channel n=1 Tax=Polaribacter gochangensis TaxID=3252903 RepID=UPI003904B55F